MNEYVFYTEEGYAEAPNGEEIGNYQILGFSRGTGIDDARNRLVAENPWITDTGFDTESIMGRELA